jgi:hypothetical protein
MHSSGYDSNHSTGRPPPERDAEPKQTVPARDLLEQVLRQTLNGASETADPAALEALSLVAARHRGRPLELQPVAVDLVHAVLSAQFPGQFGDAAGARELSAEIARTLFDDPPSRHRLEALWSRLAETNP